MRKILFIPLLVLIAPEMLFLVVLATLEMVWARLRFSSELDQVLSSEPAALWEVIKDFSSPSQFDPEFGIHDEFGILLRTGENSWQQIGVDMPEFLPPPRQEEPHG